MKQSLRPQNVSKSVWYYEEGRKLTFVVCAHDFTPKYADGGIIEFKVPISMLEKSIARSPKKVKK